MRRRAASAAAAIASADAAKGFKAGEDRDLEVPRAFYAALRPETSALLVLSSNPDLDQVRPVIERGLARGDVILKHARLPDDALEVLQQAVHDLQARSRP